MKSVFGLALAATVVLAFVITWRLATRADATFLDQQWLFFTALPYNLLTVAIFGESNFSAEAPLQLVAAASSEAAAAYLSGACVEGAARALWRRLRGVSVRA